MPLRERLLTAAIATVFFSVAHSAEDFHYDVPERFDVDVSLAALGLALLYAAWTVAIILTAREEKNGYLGNLFIGAAWFVAVVLDHGGEVLFEDPYREGLISKGLEVGLALSSAALAVLSFAALPRHSQSG